jgi:hypothetical protein
VPLIDFGQNLTSIFGSYTYGGSNFAPFVEYFRDLCSIFNLLPRNPHLIEASLQDM